VISTNKQVGGVTPDKSANEYQPILIEVGEKGSGQTVHFGITKEQFVTILSKAGQEHMYFPVVFLESCKSQLPSVQMASLKSSQPVGIVFASDASGLGYQTIDYDSLGKLNLPASRFSGLFFHALWNEFVKQQTPDVTKSTVSSVK
jgi:hypothetical protein